MANLVSRLLIYNCGFVAPCLLLLLVSGGSRDARVGAFTYDNIRTLIRAAGDHTITGTAPAALPPEEHEEIVTLPERPRYRVADLPAHPSAWDDRMSLRREDFYADDGR